MPEIGDTTSLFPGHKGVFKGEYAYGCPVYETQLPELMEADQTAFTAMFKRLSNVRTADTEGVRT